jgi:F5/8 type C domain-containing protein
MIPTLQLGQVGRYLVQSGPPPLTPHRYWRLLITAPDGSPDYCGMTELEMRATVGGADWTLTAAASSSSDINGTNTSDLAFDNNNTTGWLSAVPTTSWIKQNLGPTSTDWRACAQILIRGSYNAPDASPKNFQLQWSDNDSAWTTVLTVAGQTGWTGASDARTFNVP